MKTALPYVSVWHVYNTAPDNWECTPSLYICSRGLVVDNYFREVVSPPVCVWNIDCKNRFLQIHIIHSE